MHPLAGTDGLLFGANIVGVLPFGSCGFRLLVVVDATVVPSLVTVVIFGVVNFGGVSSVDG